MACQNRRSERGVGETMFRKMRKEVSQSAKAKKTAIYQHYLGDGRNQVSQPAKASCETCETSETALISMLQKELDRKNEQLEVKDKQIEELNARLADVSSALVAAQQTAQVAQALHAGTLQQRLTSGGEMREVVDDKPQKRGWFSRLFFGEDS